MNANRRILRSRGIRGFLSIVTIAVVAVGGDLSSHFNHIDAPVTTNAHETDGHNPGRTSGHNAGTLAHHSCGVHLCFHQLDRTPPAMYLSPSPQTRLPRPDFAPASGILFVPSIERPPKPLS